MLRIHQTIIELIRELVPIIASIEHASITSWGRSTGWHIADESALGLGAWLAPSLGMAVPLWWISRRSERTARAQRKKGRRRASRSLIRDGGAR